MKYLALSEPAPLWPDAPRYCPEEPLPPYRFVRGLNPHPVTNPAGHLYGQARTVVYVPPARWRENRVYLFGVDLYHQAYFWEAHEAWEGLWRLPEAGPVERAFCQCLILNCAAQIKAHVGRWRGVSRLSARAHRQLARVYEDLRGHAPPAAQKEPFARGPDYMGIDVGSLLVALDACYGHLWPAPQNTAARGIGPAPRLELAV